LNLKGRLKRHATRQPNIEKSTVRSGKHAKSAWIQHQELASKIDITRYVLADHENGKPTTAIAAYIGALWALDILAPMRAVADPDSDEVGKTLERARAPKTAPKRSKGLDNDF